MVTVMIKDTAIGDVFGAVVSETLTVNEICDRLDKIIPPDDENYDTDESRLSMIEREFAGEDGTEVIVMSDDIGVYYC